MIRFDLFTIAGFCLSATTAWAAPTPSPVGPATSEAPAPESHAPQAPPSAATVPPAVAPSENTATAASPTAAPSAISSVSPSNAASSAVEPSPYGPSLAEQKERPSVGRGHADANVPATLWDKNYDYAFGGMGGIGVAYTRFAGKNTVLVCGEGAVIIDHALTLGGGGCGVTRMIKASDYASDEYEDNDRMTFGYGGAILRYHFFSRKMINYSAGVLVGAGAVATGSWNGSAEDAEDKFDAKRRDALFVIEPQVGAHLNITRWLRAGIMAGYRLVAGVDTVGLEASDIDGIVAGGQLQGGWF